LTSFSILSFELPHQKLIMGKSNFFIGQPIFSQILSLIPRDLVKACSKMYDGDRYCKRFDSFHHLVSMLFAGVNHCTSLREVTTGLLAWEHRIQHLGLNHFPRRATFSDANSRRPHQVFEAIYYKLLGRYGQFLPDSRSGKGNKNVYIFDTTVITLFSEVLRGTGKHNHLGKRKGGVKVHTLIRSDQDVPCMVYFSAAKENDSQFLKLVRLPADSIVVFDKGYRNYSAYNRLHEDRVTWITPLRKRTVFKIVRAKDVEQHHALKGIISDEEIMMGNDYHADAVKVRARLIKYKDIESGKALEFITNNFRVSPIKIADYYKQRWQIETLFKRLKQNFPLKYFLGDSENAIKIQIWCVLIIDLLLKIIKSRTKTTMSYSNMVSMIRLHIMTYLDLKTFLQATEKQLIDIFNTSLRNTQTHDLFSP
jgi:hypothetical protein